MKVFISSNQLHMLAVAILSNCILEILDSVNSLLPTEDSHHQLYLYSLSIQLLCGGPISKVILPSLKKHPYLGRCPNRGWGGGVWPNPNLLNRFSQVTDKLSKLQNKCSLQNNSIIMTTNDFSMKSVVLFGI